MQLGGVVLAAGRSTRMGRDKALLEEGGVPMWQRQRDVLIAAGAAEVFLSVRPEQHWAVEATGFASRLHDAIPGGGPLVGITAAIERSTCDHVAVLAIDLPEMPPAWFTALRALCAPGLGAVGRRDERFEPLAAIYPRSFMHHAWPALAAARYALQPLIARAVELGELRVRDIRDEEARWFTNRNQ